MRQDETLSRAVEAAKNITKDKAFKRIVKYKGIAALLVKYAIPEFEQMRLPDVARHILDIGRENTREKSDAEILADEVDFLQESSGVEGEKLIVLDGVFKMKVNDEVIGVEIKYSNLTVDLEMQNDTSTKSLGYNLISRAIYYGADLLRKTVPAGSENYADMHKVYSIWFCSNNLDIEVYPEVADRYVYRYGVRRFYKDLSKCAPPEPYADFIEVVLVELKKLKAYDSDTAEMVHKLFYDRSNFVNLIEQKEKVTLTTVKEGVMKMTDFEEVTKQLVENVSEVAKREGIKEGKEAGIKEGKAEGKRESAISMLHGGKLTVEEIAEYSGLSLVEVEQLKTELK